VARVAINKSPAWGVGGAHRIPREVGCFAWGEGPMYSECYTSPFSLYSKINTRSAQFLCAP
jgi:hypothetical protein